MSIFYKSMVWSQFEYQSWQWQLPGDILRECHANQLSAQKWDHDILYKKRKKKTGYLNHGADCSSLFVPILLSNTIFDIVQVYTTI